MCQTTILNMQCVLLLVAVAVITVAIEVQFEISGNASNRTAPRLGRGWAMAWAMLGHGWAKAPTNFPPAILFPTILLGHLHLLTVI